MKIIQLNVSASGSTGRIAQAIHRELEAKGNKPFFAYGISRSQMSNSLSISSYIESRLHDRFSKITGKQGYFSLVRTMQLIERMRVFDPDIVHLHNLHGNYLYLPLLFRYLRSSRAQIVITLHDCWLFTGKCPHFFDVGCNNWKEQCGNCPQLDIYPKSYWVDRTQKNLADKKKWISGLKDRLTIVTVSEWLKTVAAQSYLGEYPIQRIYNGVDTNVFHPLRERENSINEKFGLAGKFVILGVASVWDKRKGLALFCEIAAHLKEDERIVLVGLSPKQCEDLPTRVIGISRTENQQELVELYSRADVLFNASTEETFGLVAAEAMACGTPVVVFDSTACPELVTPDTGRVIKTKNCAEIYEVLNEMKVVNFKLNNSRACRQRIVECFGAEKMVSEYMKVYADIIR